MSQNHNERRRKFIEQLKSNGKFEDYKKHRSQLEKARRERKKNALANLSDTKRKLLAEEERMKNRNRVRKHRQAKKGRLETVTAAATETNKDNNWKSTSQSTSKNTFDFPNSYQSPSAIRKDYTKTNKTLPSSPSKRKVIVTKLVRSFDEGDRKDVLGNSKFTVTRKDTGLDRDLISSIEVFYERDSVSRVSPNVKDAKPFKNTTTGKKEIRPLRHLLFTLSEVYTMFVEEYKQEKGCIPPVKISKFCELRPDHVLLIGQTPRNVCHCIYHANFSQCCIAINKYESQLSKCYKDMVKMLVCENATEDCYFKKCKKCSTVLINKKLKNLSKTVKKKSVNWLQWTKDKEANRFQNELQSGSFQQLMDYLIKIYGPFLKHSYVMHAQADYFDIDQKRVDSEAHFDEATLNIDFPENYKCESQDEIQQANYNQKQISLFVAVLRHRKSLHSKAIASDNTHHTKETIVAYLYTTFESFPSTVKTVKIWSDGPSSQFKNKFIAAVIPVLEQKFGVKIYWNFYATAHGKSCVDGLGAIVKKKVRSMVLAKHKIVYETSEFVDAFNSKNSDVDVSGLTDKEIDEINAHLNLSYVFSQAKAVRGISECHQLQYIKNCVKGFVTSKDGYTTVE